ncbi:MAG: 16S rRNA (cytosine(1402)-N(4))-methyltransferase RsmH [Lachnospirales bacterium]
MDLNFEHISVLLHECIDNLDIKEDGIYIDGTMGGGGHSLEIVKKLGNGRLICIDQDENAHIKAKEVLKDYSSKITFVRDNFRNVKKILEDLEIDKIDGILLDLGVSSHQLDEGERGFSYNFDAPLDMRMDKRSNISAYNIVNEYSEEKLHQIIKEYGEERWAKRIAQFIVNEREVKPIETTFELVTVLKKAIPKGAREDKHPAKRTFQAIRIEVNGELDIIKDTIYDINDKLNVGGRICIITFHSLEDRIVKHTYKELNSPCTCPREFPVCVCNKKPQVKIITRKGILPSFDEIENNKRSRSAKLRVAEKI